MRRPPALKAIFPVNYTDNRYTDDCHYKGGTLQMLYDTYGYMLMIVRNVLPPPIEAAGERWAELWAEHLQNEPWILTWLEHQTYDDYWKQGSLCEDYGAIEAATYLVVTIQLAITMDGQPHFARSWTRTIPRNLL